MAHPFDFTVVILKGLQLILCHTNVHKYSIVKDLDLFIAFLVLFLVLFCVVRNSLIFLSIYEETFKSLPTNFWIIQEIQLKKTIILITTDQFVMDNRFTCTNRFLMYMFEAFNVQTGEWNSCVILICLVFLCSFGKNQKV